MTRVETWLGFALIGVVVGAVSLSLGVMAWPPAAGVVVVAALSRSRMSALGGTLIGLAVGAAISFWLGSVCPPGAVCRPELSIGYVIGFVLITLCTGVLASFLAATSRSA